MYINEIVKSLENCPCGREHKVDKITVDIAPGLVRRTGIILQNAGFPQNILVVADKNTLAASEGILESLKAAGFDCKLKLFDDMRTADMEQVSVLAALCRENPGIGGILSVGTGSINDICRYAAFLEGRRLAIFATAPSMDGFASGTAPITEKGFKTTRQAVQPSVIIADTDILAAAPAELKSAGFGDMMAKYIALADWKISRLLTGEHYCENIAALTRRALDTMVALAPRVTKRDGETAAAIMEALIFTGFAMKLANSVRPASGAEHIISHFWEMKKLEAGQISDYHGKKVGVATLMALSEYKKAVLLETVNPHPDIIDWESLRRVYGENLIGEVVKLNTPSVTDETKPSRIAESWGEIRRIVNEELPSVEEMTALMKTAGAATTLEEISVSPELGAEGLKFHPYMRHRMTLARILPMITSYDDNRI